ncbi:MAG: hypothetical protein KA419_16190 [Acidobacteria bacterium]|nr:hypothetical protein [Acidobacteriota bacterium]
MTRHMHQRCGERAPGTLRLVLAALAAFAAQPWPAADVPCRPLGPEGGNVLALAANPANLSETYAAFYPNQLFRTTDGGATWGCVHRFDRALNGLVLDPTNPDRLFASCTDGVYRSSDRGASWAFAPHGREGLYFLGLRGAFGGAPTLHAFGMYYPGGPIGVCRSSDGGVTWSETRLGENVQGAYPFDLAPAPSNPSVLYLSAMLVIGNSEHSARIFRSADGGATWEDVSGDLPPENEFTGLAVDPGQPDTVYATGLRGTFASNGGGGAWSAGQGPAPGYAVAVDPSNPAVVYVGSLGKCYRSPDRGQHWTACAGAFEGEGYSLLVGPGRVWAGSTAGIYRSTDGGDTWVPSREGVRATVVSCLAVLPGVPVSAGGPGSPGEGCGFGPAPAGARTVDPRPGPPASRAFTAAFTPPGSLALLASCSGFGLLGGNDAGTPWRVLTEDSGCDSVRKIFQHPSEPSTLFILSGG